MRRNTLITHILERRIFFLELFILAALCVAYAYCVSASIVHVIVRKEIDRSIAEVSSDISRLEASFIQAKDVVTLEYAKEYGFTVYKPKKRYIAGKSSSDLVLVTQDQLR